MSTDDPRATGVGAAVLLDTLLDLGIDDPFTLTRDQQIAALEQAVAEGRLDAGKVDSSRPALAWSEFGSTTRFHLPRRFREPPPNPVQVMHR